MADIFELTPVTPVIPPVAPVQDQKPADPFATQLSGIVGVDGKQKYADTTTALAALSSSQEHISVQSTALTAKDTEIAQLREELTKRKTVEDFVSTLNPPAQVPTPPVTPAVEQGVSEEATKVLIRNAMLAQNASDAATANYESVVGKLTEAYGDKASAVIASRAAELNTTTEALKALAQDNPTMALSLFKDVKAPAGTNPLQSTTVTPLQATQTELPPNPNGKSFSRGGFTQKDLMDSYKEVEGYTHKTLGIES